MVAQDTIDDITFLSNNYDLGINLNTKNNKNVNIKQATSTPSIFNSQTSNNNIEFAGLDKEKGDNFGLVGGTISAGLDLTVQGIEYLYGTRQELDKTSLVVSFGTGMAGVGLASKVQKLGTLAKFGAETAIDASVSTTS